MGTSSKVFRLRANVYDGFENEFFLFLYFVHCVLTSLEHARLIAYVNIVIALKNHYISIHYIYTKYLTDAIRYGICVFTSYVRLGKIMKFNDLDFLILDLWASRDFLFKVLLRLYPIEQNEAYIQLFKNKNKKFEISF